MTSKYPFPSKKFWRGRRVWISGHSGFKGAWLTLWLLDLGARVHGFSLRPPGSNPSLYRLLCFSGKSFSEEFQDLREPRAVMRSFQKFRPEFVFHLAAQALVLEGYRDASSTMEVNFLGTVYMLEAVRSVSSVRTVLAVTTDKVYRNERAGQRFREEDSLGGIDPYSASKAAAEMALACYRDSFLKKKGVALAVARAGNVIGGGDWSSGRLLPDAIKAWKSHRPLQVRNPLAIRPWQHVLDPLAGYLRIAEKCRSRPELAGAYNLGPARQQVATVKAVLGQARKYFGSGAFLSAKKKKLFPEKNTLLLESIKARRRLGIYPVCDLEKAILMTVNWYKLQGEGYDPADLCRNDIIEFCHMASARNGSH